VYLDYNITAIQKQLQSGKRVSTIDESTHCNDAEIIRSGKDDVDHRQKYEE
jgi:hypothetical protein